MFLLLKWLLVLHNWSRWEQQQKRKGQRLEDAAACTAVLLAMFVTKPVRDKVTCDSSVVKMQCLALYLWIQGGSNP